MSLFKVAIYGGIGYLIYQMFFAELPVGSERNSGQRRRSGQQRRVPNAEESRDRGSGRNLTGPGIGYSEEVQESDGGTRRRTVGRGVV